MLKSSTRLVPTTSVEKHLPSAAPSRVILSGKVAPFYRQQMRRCRSRVPPAFKVSRECGSAGRQSTSGRRWVSCRVWSQR